MRWAIVAISAVPLFFIGDVPWVNDEPRFLALALEANAHGVLAPTGLVGTVGVAYGPAAIWFYQALLALSHDLIVVAFLHAAIMSAAVAIALLWLSRTLALWPPFALVLLLSPYLWFYDRALWDNTALLPLGALAFAAFASYRVHARPWALVLALVFLAPMPLVHPMALALVIPLFVHLAIVARRQWCWLVGASLLLGVALVLAAFPYFRSLLQVHLAPHANGDFASGFFFPLLGGQLLSAVGFNFIWRSSAVWRAWSWLTAGGFVLVWLGLGLAVRTAWSRLPSPRRSLSRLALAVVAAQALLDGATHSFFFPHYFNATWIAFALLAWTAVERLGAWRARLVIAHGLALAVFLLVTIAGIHVHQGNRTSHYGATLANQIAVAQALQSFAAAPLVDVDNLKSYPQALSVLRTFFPPRADASPLAPRIGYASDDTADGRIALAPP